MAAKTKAKTIYLESINSDILMSQEIFDEIYDVGFELERFNLIDSKTISSRSLLDCAVWKMLNEGMTADDILNAMSESIQEVAHFFPEQT